MRIGGAGKENGLAFARFDAAPVVEMRFLNTL